MYSWTEAPAGLQSTGSQSQTRLRDFTFTFTFIYTAMCKQTAKWEPAVDRELSSVLSNDLERCDAGEGGPRGRGYTHTHTHTHTHTQLIHFIVRN